MNWPLGTRRNSSQIMLNSVLAERCLNKLRGFHICRKAAQNQKILKDFKKYNKLAAKIGSIAT